MVRTAHGGVLGCTPGGSAVIQEWCGSGSEKRNVSLAVGGHGDRRRLGRPPRVPAEHRSEGLKLHFNLGGTGRALVQS